MGSSDTHPAQRARPKAPDFSEFFRSANASRHSSRTGAGTKTSPSSSPSPGDKPGGTKVPSRRSMLPFLGRKKPAEQTAGTVLPSSRKSVGNPSYPVTTVNTVRRSFGNGHAVLMITPSTQSLPAEPPLPSKFPVDAQVSSFGSKLAAHFTPLRSPYKNSKAHSSATPKPAASVPTPPVPSVTHSPHVPEVRTPSIESQHSSMRSRSTTPRPLRGPHPPTAIGDEEDFSDLFTLPDHLKKPPPSPKTPTTPVYVYPGDPPKKSGELTPTTPITPSGPPLQFPIPPSTFLPRSLLADKGLPRQSSELASPSSQRSKSPSNRPSPASGRMHCRNLPSQDERQSGHRRTISMSGGDTDTSRANESAYSARSFNLPPVVPKSIVKKPLASSSRTASGPPPSVPLPSPPISANSAGSGPQSAPGTTAPSRVVFPRPRANTVSITSNLAAPSQIVSRSNLSSPPRVTRANSVAGQDATIDELREALAQQRRKNVQLQDYIVTVTKRYEDDRMAMTRNIEKLERNIRKKMREIEGLRWLVIHNGAVSDIDAAANLARSSLSTQDGDTVDEGIAPVPSPLDAFPPHHGHQSPAQKGVPITPVTPELRSDASSSVASLPASLLDATPVSTQPPPSFVPERVDTISRAERQRLKEERRASKALRRISAVSNMILGTDPPTKSLADDAPNPKFDPKQSMDEVMERLQPFRHA